MIDKIWLTYVAAYVKIVTLSCNDILTRSIYVFIII